MKILDAFKKFLFDNKDQLQEDLKHITKELESQLLEVKEFNKDKKPVYVNVEQIEKSVQKAIDGSDVLIIRGIASNTNIDRVGDIIIPAGVKIIPENKSSIPMLFNHDDTQIVGSFDTTMIQRTDKELIVWGKIHKSYNEVVYNQVLNGDLNCLSVGFFPLQEEPHPKIQGVTIYKSIDLFEISLVAIPAHPEAMITDVMEANVKNLNTTESVTEDVPASKDNSAVSDETVVVNTKESEEISRLVAELSVSNQELQKAKEKISSLEVSIVDKDAELVELNDALKLGQEIVQSLNAELEIKNAKRKAKSV